MKLYQVIYADPPWRYNFVKSKTREIEKHYATMDIDEIKNMDIPIADGAVLFLWATAPKLIEALEVLRSWGFTYKTNAIWDKVTIGMGYWFRGQHELLLVGTRGSFSPPTESERISSVIRTKKKVHSAKPNLVRSLISEWYPTKNKLELFARERFEGWDVWGNEAPSDTQKLLI